MNKLKPITLAIILLPITIGTSATPQKEPLQTTGNNFLTTTGSHPKIHALFDNTTVWVDPQNDGVQDYKFTRDSGKTLGLGILPIKGKIETGAKIKTSKPIIIEQNLNRNDENEYMQIYRLLHL